MELRTFIKNWQETHSKQANFALIKQIEKNKDYLIKIKTFVNFNSENNQQLLYHYINNTKDIPKCLNCNNLTNFYGLSQGYSKFCSKGCKTSYDHKQGKFIEGHKKGSQNFKNNYGKNSKNYTELQEKIKLTCMERYGTDHPMKNKKVLEKYIQSCIKKHNETNPMKTSIVSEKVSTTNIQKYGFKRPLQNPDISKVAHQNHIKTMNKKYGVSYISHVPEFLEKAQRNSFKLDNYKHISYQGTYEFDFIKHCENLKILDKISNGPFLWFIHSTKKRYFSDFYIKEINLIIEIKSKYYFKKFKKLNLSKQQACLNQGYNFIFIIDKDYGEFDKIINLL